MVTKILVRTSMTITMVFLMSMTAVKLERWAGHRLFLQTTTPTVAGIFPKIQMMITTELLIRSMSSAKRATLVGFQALQQTTMPMDVVMQEKILMTTTTPEQM